MGLKCEFLHWTVVEYVYHVACTEFTVMRPFPEVHLFGNLIKDLRKYFYSI